ncbi:ABC-three component system middle component 6 [Aeromonas veronii]|uniref:ABC-three component system middle component 6 n=2 Tax=Aeromonadaceae TaxID=84642 RepID=UPI003CC8093C
MIPRRGCDPEINIVSMGAKILEILKRNSLTLDEILIEGSSELSVSTDHIILTLDWLFLIKAIDFDGVGVFINETR